ncbi:MAG: hypothetical protein LC775_02435 [Acidobacteria bacterium]|nr:hypothetical protein [Acidobacteriota bacterium]
MDAKKGARDNGQDQKKETVVSLTVHVTLSELAALSKAAVVVTSAGETRFINAADRGLRKVRDAAVKHPRLPNLFNDRT